MIDWEIIIGAKKLTLNTCLHKLKSVSANPNLWLSAFLGEIAALFIKAFTGLPSRNSFNNAAISPKNADNKRLGFADTDLSLWRQVFNVNFFAPIIISQSIINNLKLAKGVIINVTSIASDNVHQFAGPAYATSKAALKSLTREMASDLAHEGIRVNAIAPGEIETSMVTPDSKKLLTEKIPMKRFGTPEEVAGVIHSMCSETFSYVNGTEIQINGGQTV